jgi:hypothetical protein
MEPVTAVTTPGQLRTYKDELYESWFEITSGNEMQRLLPSRPKRKKPHSDNGLLGTWPRA